MDVEKYTSGKLYSFFEWAFKLILWNVLLVLVIITIVAAPFYGFYKVQDNNLIKEVTFEHENVLVVQKNNRKTTIEGAFKNEELKLKEYNIDDSDDDKYLLTLIFENETVIKYIIDEEYKDVAVENGIVIGILKDGSTINIDVIYEVDYEEAFIDRDRHLILSYRSGNKIIDLGIKVETQNGLASIFLVIAVVLAVFVFIPIFVTVFSMIKIYGDNEGRTTIGLFFDRLWDNFKSLYKLELIMIPVICLFTFATYYYYVNIINSKTLGSNFESLYVIGYNFLLVTLIIIFLCLLNLPMTLGYFRMNTKTIMKFTFIMTFKNILFTFIYLFSFLMPLLLCVMNTIFIPLWFLCGISLPLYICYIISRSKYRYLVKNLEDIQTELTENTDIYKFTDKERGEE